MPSLPTPAIGTIQQFAQQMELSAYESEDGSYSFEFERSGRLTIIATESDDVIVTLAPRLLFDDLNGMAVLVPLAGYDPERDQITYVGMNRAGQGTLGLKCPAQAFNLPYLEQAFTTLSQKFDQVRR